MSLNELEGKSDGEIFIIMRLLIEPSSAVERIQVVRRSLTQPQPW